MIRFGPSGNSDSFYDEGYKTSIDMPKWLKGMGLNAYEYQCNKGTNISISTAEKIGQKCVENDIYLSIHAPYYINLANIEKQKRDASRGYIMETLKVAKWMGAKRVVIHVGSIGKLTRNEAQEYAYFEFKQLVDEVNSSEFSDIVLCPEVLGKINQFGDLDEILEICKLDERIIPTIDFAHIHARSLGGLKTIDDFNNLFSKIERTIGYERIQKLHIHFSKVEYSKGGEKRHRAFSDEEYGPEFEPLARILIEKKLEPIIICESRGSMAEDALSMKKIYENLLEIMWMKKV